MFRKAAAITTTVTNPVSVPRQTTLHSETGQQQRHQEQQDQYAEFSGDPVHQYADMVRYGAIQNQNDIKRLMSVAGGIIRCVRRDYDSTTVVYMDRKGRQVAADDAELVRAKADPAAWAYTPEKYQTLQQAYELFNGRETELDMPFEDIPAATKLRVELAGMLGIANPDRFTYDQLAYLADRHASLMEPPMGQVIPQEETAERLASEPAPAAAKETAGPETAKPDEVLPPVTPAVPKQRRPYRGSSAAAKSPPAKVQTRPSRYPVRRLVAATICAAGALLLSASVAGDGPPPKANTAKVAVVPEQMAGGAQAPPEKPPGTPVQLPEPDRIMTFGDDYDPDKRTGAVWFVVENDAARQGCPKLTLSQSYELTDRALNYMGITWAGARELSADTQLRFPSAQTMRSWLTEVVGSNACTPAGQPPERTLPV